MNKKNIFIASVFIILIIAAIFYFKIFQRSAFFGENGDFANEFSESKKNNMNISSLVFEHNSLIPAKYTCDGENISPSLRISEVPEDAKSLVLTVDDPDAPGGTWLHWTVWNINSQTDDIAEGSTPEGAAEGKTDFGKLGWGGPCPPSGTHRYFFKLYALGTVLNLAAGAELRELQNAMEGHILDKAELIGLYSRK